MHVRAALTGWFSSDDIKEIIIQQAIYCGVRAPNHAFKLVGEIVAELASPRP
jgi:4-carboxymuconolactone decarboxylase